MTFDTGALLKKLSLKVEFREHLFINSHIFIKALNEFQQLFPLYLDLFSDCIYLQRTLQVMWQNKCESHESPFGDSRSLMNTINEILLLCLHF